MYFSAFMYIESSYCSRLSISGDRRYSGIQHIKKMALWKVLDHKYLFSCTGTVMMVRLSSSMLAVIIFISTLRTVGEEALVEFLEHSDVLPGSTTRNLQILVQHGLSRLLYCVIVIRNGLKQTTVMFKINIKNVMLGIQLSW